MKIFENVTFSPKTFLSHAGKIFSGRMKMFKVSKRSPDIALLSRNQLTIIQSVDKKYSRKTKIWSQKINLSCLPLYIPVGYQ